MPGSLGWWWVVHRRPPDLPPPQANWPKHLGRPEHSGWESCSNAFAALISHNMGKLLDTKISLQMGVGGVGTYVHSDNLNLISVSRGFPCYFVNLIWIFCCYLLISLSLSLNLFLCRIVEQSHWHLSPSPISAHRDMEAAVGEEEPVAWSIINDGCRILVGDSTWHFFILGYSMGVYVFRKSSMPGLSST